MKPNEPPKNRKSVMHGVMDRLKRRIRLKSSRTLDSVDEKEAASTTTVEPINPSNKTTDALLAPMLLLRDVTNPEEKRDLFIRKLHLCSIVFDFTKLQVDHNEGLAKEMKRQYLGEIIDHITESEGWCSERVIVASLKMIDKNLFRSLPPSSYTDFDVEDDDPAFDPAWPHLSLVYEFFLRFMTSRQAEPSLIKTYIHRRSFILNILDLFDSEDVRERNYVKTVLHRIYGRFMSYRSFIRRAVSNVFMKVIYETERHNGISELLEIFGSIINGFALPLKLEHKAFLRNVLIPLHKVKILSQFQQQLAYCVVQFVDKDPSLSSVVIGGMLKFWPSTSSKKQSFFLDELEEIIELTPPGEFEKIMVPLFCRIGQCIGNLHFGIAQRALWLWKNDVFSSFAIEYRSQLLPIVYPALQANSNRHWNKAVHVLTFQVQDLFIKMDVGLYDNIAQQCLQEDKERNEKRHRREEQWMLLRGHGVNVAA